MTEEELEARKAATTARVFEQRRIAAVANGRVLTSLLARIAKEVPSPNWSDVGTLAQVNDRMEGSIAILEDWIELWKN